MKKYKIFIVTIISLLLMALIAIICYYFWQSQIPGKKEITENSVIFTNNWLSYSDETSDEYIASWSGMTSKDFTDDFKSTTSNLREMRGNSKPTVSVFTHEGEPKTLLSGTSYITTISGTQRLSYEKLSKEIQVTIVWNKTNQGYKITDAYTDK